jgi:hypothetical protein
MYNCVEQIRIVESDSKHDLISQYRLMSADSECLTGPGTVNKFGSEGKILDHHATYG